MKTLHLLAAVALACTISCRTAPNPDKPAAQTAAQTPAAAQPAASAPAPAPTTPAAEKQADAGESPKVTVTSANPAPLGSPTILEGIVSNPNPFPITKVKVTFMHIDVGEDKDVVLFEKSSVPAKGQAPWKTSVTFEKGHPPDALISHLAGWERAGAGSK